jgi:hypothetical protein
MSSNLSMANSSPPLVQQGSPLFRILPRELRDMIYGFYVYKENGYRQHSPGADMRL